LDTNLRDTAIDKDNADELLKELPAYDEIDDNKAVLSLPTYETATKLTTDSLNIKGTSNYSR
jgi:cytidylate kinase